MALTTNQHYSRVEAWIRADEDFEKLEEIAPCTLRHRVTEPIDSINPENVRWRWCLVDKFETTEGDWGDTHGPAIFYRSCQYSKLPLELLQSNLQSWSKPTLVRASKDSENLRCHHGPKQSALVFISKEFSSKLVINLKVSIFGNFLTANFALKWLLIV